MTFWLNYLRFRISNFLFYRTCPLFLLPFEISNCVRLGLQTQNDRRVNWKFINTLMQEMYIDRKGRIWVAANKQSFYFKYKLICLLLCNCCYYYYSLFYFINIIIRLQYNFAVWVILRTTRINGNRIFWKCHWSTNIKKHLYQLI